MRKFMLDTCILNELAKSFEDENLVYQSKSRGFEYYFTETQNIEVRNNINSKAELGKEQVSRVSAERGFDLYRIMSKIQTHYAGPIATMVENSWKLDGTREFLSEDETQIMEVFAERYHNNPERYNDALIAATGLHNGCVIVTEDGDFRRDVNKFLPGGAITYDEFISYLKNQK